MSRMRGLEQTAGIRGCVLSIGNFDGVHRGHQTILERLVAHARRLSVPSIVMTFEPHPAALLNPERQPPRLTLPQLKADLIQELGVDSVLEYPTDWALLHLSPGEFFQQIVLGRLDAVGLVEGPNFFFGQHRAGDVRTLQMFCEEAGRFLDVVEPTARDGELISSSLIRKALLAGDVTRAAELLGRLYSVSGTVVSGARRGRLIGFPTANVDRIETLIPADGVYAAQALVRGQLVPAAVSIGPNPTFSDGTRKVEAHLLDFSETIYGEEITLCFRQRIRELQNFDSPEKLQDQIRQDIMTVREVLLNDD